jgi:hypothetical protein
MIKKKGCSEWFIFYQGLFDELQAHFAAGGTVDDLNGSRPNTLTALYNCINEWGGDDEVEPFKLMLDNGAIMTEIDWAVLFRCDRSPHLEELLSRSTPPPPYIASIHWGVIATEHPWSPRCGVVLAKYYCRQATRTCLCIAKAHHQPMSDIWRIIARKVWDTKKSMTWAELAKRL